jgi:glycosyltransferase involved in cell wall biosynthesis
LFIPPDRPDLLAAAITRVLSEPHLAESMAREAYAAVQEFTWDRRAERIQGFVADLMAR